MSDSSTAPLPAALISGPARLWDYHAKSSDELFRQVGNTGNLAFRYAVQKHLGRNTPIYSWGAPAATIRSKAKVVVIPCANQLGEHFDGGQWAGVVEKVDLPTVAIGLGAQADSSDGFPHLKEGTERWLRAVVERASDGQPNIALRGEYTRRLLEKMKLSDSGVVLGCPSLFISDDPALGVTIAKRLGQRVERIGVAAGNPAIRALSGLERSLFELAYESGGQYIVQHPQDFIKLARQESSDLTPTTRMQYARYIGFSRADGSLTPSEQRAVQVYFDIDAWMEQLRRHDLVVGTRIHGTMLAIQAGVPALCIVHDTRTEELCQTMGIPHLQAESIDIDRLSASSLLKLIRFDPEVFDQNRQQLLGKYLAFLKANRLPVAPSLQDLSRVSVVSKP